jgi:hypothetical protein
MIYVVAGNQEQAYQYINRKLEERIRNGEEVSRVDDYSYVRDVDTLRGILNPRGVFIGTWRERKDIKDIVQQLMVTQSHVNPILIKIWKELKKTPTKLTPVAGGWINEELVLKQAADMLAKSVDDEVMKQVMTKINGGDIGSI